MSAVVKDGIITDSQIAYKCGFCEQKIYLSPDSCMEHVKSEHYRELKELLMSHEVWLIRVGSLEFKS